VVNAWIRPDEQRRIPPGEAHVWTLSTHVPEAVTARLQSLLPEEERRRAERIRHGETRSGFVVTRSALRALLGHYLGVPREDLALRYSVKGKPALAMAHEGGVHFSVAHSGGVAMLAFAGVEVGIDVERIRHVPRERRVMDRVFAGEVSERLRALPPTQRRAAFFAAWTQREALVKALGGALLATRDPLDFHWPSSVAPRRFTGENDAGETVTWTVATLPAADGFAATLVALGEVDDVRQRRLAEVE
jgi:4'-phosphopantetheinyl transferase